jgi:hypothetical protein
VGYLCPACEHARESVIGVGPRLRERALLDHLDATG